MPSIKLFELQIKFYLNLQRYFYISCTESCVYFRIFNIIVNCEYSKMTHHIMHTYLYEAAHDVCYKWSIENKFFVSVTTNKGKIGMIECCC